MNTNLYFYKVLRTAYISTVALVGCAMVRTLWVVVIVGDRERRWGPVAVVQRVCSCFCSLTHTVAWE